MALEIRTMRPEELDRYAESMSITFNRDYKPDPEALERRRELQEMDRSIIALDGSQVVGTASAFTYEMATPGGVVKTGGLTSVTVRSTHRRQGILNEMMRQHFDDCLSRGEPVSALWAAESIIYGRYGYGVATRTTDVTIERARAAIAAMPHLRGRVRMIEPDEAREQWPALWQAMHHETPGMMTRSDAWWRTRIFADPADWRDGYTANRYANYEAAGEALGYLRYRVKNRWDEDLPNGTLKVEEIVTTSPEAYAALWQFALSVDLIGTIEASFRPLDEPLYFMLADPRRLRRTFHDGIWVRILDIPKALEARRYSAEGRLVLAIADGNIAANTGTYALEATPGGARCTRTNEPAQLSCTIADLSAAYLGGTRWDTLAQAGRVTGDAASLALADGMFDWPRQPWCPEMF